MLTAESRSEEFPLLREITYLNTAAEGLPPRGVWENVQRYWEHKRLGMRGRDFHFPEVERCRERAAQLLDKKPSEVAFCSCSSEAYNLLASALQLQEQDEVIISDLDFPAGATPWLRAARQPTVHVWRNRDGALDLSDLDSLLNDRTRLVQVSLVSFLTGYRIPWAPFRDLVRVKAPHAILSVDITQAFGRIELDCLDADCLISSTHKWILGFHGSCIVAIPEPKAAELTTHAGGWFHLANAFDADRFERAEAQQGAASFAVGMPSFAAVYALRAAMDYVCSIGVERIVAHADPLVRQVHEELVRMKIQPMAPLQPDCMSGIVAFQHPEATTLEAHLAECGIQVMHQAGRIRISLHGYNQPEDVEPIVKAMRP